MTPFFENANVWLLIDDRAGNKAQVMGVAQALGGACTVKTIAYNTLARLPNLMLGTSFKTLDTLSRKDLVEPWPDLVIAAGRRTAPIAQHIKKMSGGKTKLVQIMYPGGRGEDDFCLIAVPRHDGLDKASNRFEIIGAPHGVTADVLEDARKVWAEKFAHLPSPHIALIVGGSTKNRTFTPTMARDLGTQARKLAKDMGGSLLVTTSRRSTVEATKALIEALGDTPTNIFKWGDTGENPYFGYLALASYTIVTGDSVSMCCEAAATNAPLYIFAPKDLITDKHARLHQTLYEQGYAKPLNGNVAFEKWTHPPLNAAQDIAIEIKRRMND
ncbi:MAG: nucleoside-diphosphate sugar epimerase [Rhodospirillaceae bacterium]|nr:MAG: nucleoside-diphosphate sugar epimerase [Rhodospirillaceae bacterium]